MLPNFLVIGAARSASTWIHQGLARHPDFFVPTKVKELHFFNCDANYERGIGWYREAFAGRRHERVVGEVTPTYLCQPTAAERIHQHPPGAKLVVSLRDPTARAYSAYIGHVIAGRVDQGETIFEASARLRFDNQCSILEHGLYYRHLGRYLARFSRDRMLILICEDLESDPAGYVQSIYRFLRVNAGFVPSGLRERENPAQYSGGIHMLNRLNEQGPQATAARDEPGRRTRDHGVAQAPGEVRITAHVSRIR